MEEKDSFESNSRVYKKSHVYFVFKVDPFACRGWDTKFSCKVIKKEYLWYF